MIVIVIVNVIVNVIVIVIVNVAIFRLLLLLVLRTRGNSAICYLLKLFPSVLIIREIIII